MKKAQNILGSKFANYNLKLLFTTIFKIFSLIIFIHQSISLSIDYLKYETVVDLKLVRGFDRDFPSITLCINSKNLYHSERTENTTISHDFGNLICKFKFSYEPMSKTNCKNFSHILESYTPLGNKCITLFSALIEKRVPIKELTFIDIVSYSGIKYFALIHQNISPPHLYTDKFEFGKWDEISIKYASIIESLLPFPYETNCYDYGIGTKTSRSKEDCIVNYYRRKEYEKCGCNRKWLYYNRENMTDVEICPKNLKCNFDHKYDKKLMDKTCNKNCYNKYYFSYISGQWNLYEKFKKTFSFMRSFKDEISITHLPKMVFIEYFSSIGGLISMWFGLSLFHLIKIAYEKMSIIREKYFQHIGLTVSISTGLTKIFKRRNINCIIILVYCSIMLYQLTDMVNSYLKYETITRFEALERKFNPKITIAYVPKSIDINKLAQIYPQIKKEDEFILKKPLKRPKMRTYLEKLIADLKFEELQQISYTKSLIKSCKLFRNRQTIDCSNSRKGLLLSGSFEDWLTFHPILDNNSKSLYEDNTCNDENIDRIELTLKGSGFVLIYLGDCKSVYYRSEPFIIVKNTITQIGFTSYSVEKFENGCLKNENYSFEKCYQNCYFLNCNQTYGCVQTKNYMLYIDFELDLVSKGYKLCNHSINETDEDLFLAKCYNSCPAKCQSLHFKTKFIAHKYSTLMNETILRIFGIKSPHFQYIETLNMDLHQLIYNCGGILGLWFGLSPLNIDDLVTILKPFSVRLKIKVILITNIIFHSIYELKRLINLLHRMFRNLNINMHFTIEIEY
jgi:hypothetical protein